MKHILLLFSCIFFLFTSPTEILYANDSYMAERNVEENKKSDDLYDRLQDSIHNKWEESMNNLENFEPIEITGSLTERIIRSTLNTFYKNMKNIKAISLFIGLLSIIIGIITAALSKLNKRLRRFAISVLIITVPTILFIFVYGISLLVGMYT